MVGFGFLPQNFEVVVTYTNTICRSVNIDGVVALVGGGGGHLYYRTHPKDGGR